jgi:hypothetical protein
MRTHIPTSLIAIALAATCTPVHAAETTEAKKTYSPVFAPVAIEDRRALSIDRSNFTYSASGINSGVLQLETGLIDYLQDDKIPNADGQYKQFSFGTATLRAGILDNFEMKATLASHVSGRAKDSTGSVIQDDGLGDAIIEARYTFQGNNGEAVGFALMPYVKLPTNSLENLQALGFFNDKIEFGTQVPISFVVSDKFCVCTAPGFDVNYNGQAGNEYDLNPFFAAALWYTVTPELSLFNEWYVKKNTGTGKDDWNSYVGLGGVYYLSSNCGIDFGVNLGLSEVAPDVSTRIGITCRF